MGRINRNPDFYDWTGLERTDDTNYDIVRQMVAELGETLDDISQSN
jgi:hypothetical protein